MITTKQKGDIGEQTAVRYIENKKMKVINRNYRSRYGEIDIICRDEKIISFVEVKLRKENSFFRGIDAVDKRKKNKIIKTSYVYMQENNINLQPRFDIAEITCNNNGQVKRINYISNAFDFENDCMEDSYEFF